MQTTCIAQTTKILDSNLYRLIQKQQEFEKVSFAQKHACMNNRNPYRHRIYIDGWFMKR